MGEGEGAGVFVAALVLAEPAVVVLAGGGVGDGVVGGVGADRQGGGVQGLAVRVVEVAGVVGVAVGAGGGGDVAVQVGVGPDLVLGCRGGGSLGEG